jgi:hypothetical protein
MAMTMETAVASTLTKMLLKSHVKKGVSRSSK